MWASLKNGRRASKAKRLSKKTRGTPEGGYMKKEKKKKQDAAKRERERKGKKERERERDGQRKGTNSDDR